MEGAGMELTSRSLVYVLTATAAVALIATLWLWPRLARQRPLPMLGRLCLLTITQVSVLAVMALMVNNSYSFYTSWNDLLHPGGAALALTSSEHAKGAVPDNEKLVEPTTEGGLETVKDVLPAGKPEEVGRIDSVKVTGPESGMSDQVFVYLPPEYFIPKYARERFPVMLAIGGYPGPSLHLVEGLRLPQTASELERGGRISPTVIVMARPTVAPPRDTECVDVAGGGPRSETWFTKDLPTAMRSAYRVSHSAASWGILGYSTGGSCALRLAMRNPDVFPNAAGLAADYVVPNDRWTDGDLFGGDAQAASRTDLGWRLHVDSLFLPDGGHSFETWQRELPAALEWMSDHLVPPQDREPRS
jgi:hypothetical protein